MQTPQQTILLLEKLTSYKNRIKSTPTHFSSSCISQNQWVSEIQARLNSESSLFDQFLEETEHYVELFISSYREVSGRAEELARLVDLHLAKVDEVMEKYVGAVRVGAGLEDRVRGLEEELEQSRGTLELMVLQTETQQRYMRQRLLSEQQASSKYLQELHMETDKNQQMTLQIQQLKNKIHTLSIQLEQCNRNLQLYGEQLQKNNSKLIIQVKKRETLELRVIDLEAQVLGLERELTEAEDIINTNSQHGFNIFSNPLLDDEVCENQTSSNKLSIEVDNYRLEQKITMGSMPRSPLSNQGQQQKTLLQKNNSISYLVLQKSSSLNPQNPILTPLQNPLKKSSSSWRWQRINLDPYFCHYILLTQTVKLLKNQDEYYNMDMKPLYRDLLDEKAPFFQWREWIEQKMEGIVRKIRGL